jgi:hypothetical protein
VWVDDDGVQVGQLTPAQQQPAFFMRGFDESGTDAARAENRERVKVFMTLASDWETAGVAARVSELNLDDLRDVRAQLAGDDSQIEVRLGKEDWTKRLRQALETLDAQRQTPRGAYITYVDMTQGKRAVVGFNPHAPAANVTGTGINEIEATGDGTSNAQTLNASATNATNETNATHGDAATTNARVAAEKSHGSSNDTKSAAHAKTEARGAKDGAAKSDAKNKSEKSRVERKNGEQPVDQTHDGGRPRRVTKNG